MKHPKELPKRHLVDIVESIISHLYVMGGRIEPCKPWRFDLLNGIAEVLESRDLVPLDEDTGKTIAQVRKKAKRNIRRIRLHYAVVHHRHGEDVYVAPTEKVLDEMIYGFAKAWWHEWAREDEEGNEEKMPEDHKEAVEAYFEKTDGEEYWEYSTASIGIEE